MELWVDGVKHGDFFTNDMATQLSVASGIHAATFVSVDSKGGVLKSAVTTFTVTNAAPNPPPPSTYYASKHVFILMLENRSDKETMQDMPYLMSIASKYGIGNEAYSPSHGSWLAYGELGGGIAPKGGEALNRNCNGNGCKGTVVVDNMVREVEAAGMTWRGYFQSMPYPGFMGSSSGAYFRRHNPYPFFSDVRNSQTEQQNMVPWNGNLAVDIAADNVANYTWLVPDMNHDGHNGGTQNALAAADAYLSANLPVLLNSKYFGPNGDGVLLVTFDESDLRGDNQCSSTVSQGCGGHIFFSLIGPNLKQNYQSNTHIMQRDMLRGTCDLLGLGKCPGDGAAGHSLAEFFL